MNVRFKKTDKGEIAILPRKEYEALAAKAAEADEDIGSARLVARARKEIAAGAPLIPKKFVDRIANGENALRVLREWRDMTQLSRPDPSHQHYNYNMKMKYPLTGNCSRLIEFQAPDCQN